MADNRKDRKKGGESWPKSSLYLIAKEISATEIKTRVEILNPRGERMVRFVINGVVPVPSGIVTTQDSKAERVFKLPANTTEVKVRAETIGEPRFFDEISVIVPTTASEVKKEGKKISKLIPLGTSLDETNLYITLARVDEAGEGRGGKICFIDTALTEVQTKETNDHGTAIISLPLGESRRKAVFFLPEKPGEKIEREIPTKKGKKEPEPKIPKTETLIDRLKKAFDAGRKKGE